MQLLILCFPITSPSPLLSSPLLSSPLSSALLSSLSFYPSLPCFYLLFFSHLKYFPFLLSVFHFDFVVVFSPSLLVSKHLFTLFSVEMTGQAALGLSSIVNRLVTVFPCSSLKSLPAEVIRLFTDLLTDLTCSFLQSVAKEEEV